MSGRFVTVDEDGRLTVYKHMPRNFDYKLQVYRYRWGHTVSYGPCHTEIFISHPNAFVTRHIHFAKHLWKKDCDTFDDGKVHCRRCGANGIIRKIDGGKIRIGLANDGYGGN